MNILYLHQYFSTYSGSNGTRSMVFAKKLIKNGHKVHMICVNDERSNSGLKNKFINGKRVGYFDGIKITEFNIRYSNHKSFFERIRVFILYSIKSTVLSFNDDFEVIFASSTPLTVSLAGILNKALRGKIFIFEVRDSWPKLPIKMGILKNQIIIRILELYEKVSISYADKCIGLAPGICDDINVIRGNNYHTELIPNFCNNFIIKNNIKNVLENKYKLNITNNDFLAIFTGAHGIANGLDQILDAAKELIKIGRFEIKILFIGDGIKKYSLQERVKKEKINNCFFLPFIPKNELFNILTNIADVGLMNLENIEDFYEGTSPNKFFDYLASGIPIICNYPGWIARIINENNCGLITYPNDPINYARVLIKLADDKDLLEIMKKNSLKLSKSTYSSKIISERFINTIESTFKINSYRENNHIYNNIYSFTKGIIDKVIAFLGLIILSPLLLAISLSIKLNMGGNIFFYQKRPGKSGKIFTIIKFRTMKNKSREVTEDYLRITKLGDFLRKTSLDELPELINIIKGDMSFIGPRPLLIEYLDLYTEEQHIRHKFKPGITGLAQIKGRNKISWEEKFKYDIFYIRHRNLIMDLKILFITFIKVICKSDINHSNKNTMPKFHFKSK